MKHLAIIGLAALLMLVGCERAQAGIVSGDDTFPSVAVHTIQIFPGVLADGHPGFTETVALRSTGLSQVHRDAQVGDSIQTEIVSLDLTGSSANVGPMGLRVGDRTDPNPEHPDPPGVPVQMGASLGAIENVDTLGDDPSDFVSGISYFDIFFEIDVEEAGITLYNQVPVHMETTILALPPIGLTYFLEGPVPIYLMESGQPQLGTDPQVGVLLNATHTPTPEPSTLVIWSLLGLGCASLSLWRRRRKNRIDDGLEICAQKVGDRPDLSQRF